ncbi:MAG: ABC transporter permease [Oscillospiraceae bacterium]|nr:ABC transporter permease [Oscillospiraceae bacterium]
MGLKINIIIYSILIVIILSLSISINAIANSENSQKGAERWMTNDVNSLRYAQISAYISSTAGYTENNLPQLRNDINMDLESASIKSENENAKLWIDAYSTESTINIDKIQTLINVTGVGGDFFYFHPLPLISGNYLPSDEILTDFVLLDEILAWQIFGGYDVAGMEIYIFEAPYTVAGVVTREYGELYSLAYGGESPRMYMSFYSLNKIQPGKNITCYEIIMPNPVSNFALDMIKKSMGAINKSSVTFIENSKRYKLLNLYKTIPELPNQSMRMNNVTYPYWENIAAVKTNICAIIVFFNTVFIVIGVLFSAVNIIIIVKKYDITFKHLKRIIDKRRF